MFYFLKVTFESNKLSKGDFRQKTF